MKGSIQLALRIGPVPVPASHDVTNALVQARIDDGAGDTQSGFELVFEIPARSPLKTLFLVTGGSSGMPPPSALGSSSVRTTAG